ncbi:hypothetical protein CHS0354_027726 [Potamilus streckersoni]|uniref:Uncharacterized protein n=1 Tax=Potamilus streckersoni TaxID=2493646 RepID=A0AAE0VQU6_9BIVA|nr:hypothetical protein CHS0354_027726 [Potamilus streckersoni]
MTMQVSCGLITETEPGNGENYIPHSPTTTLIAFGITNEIEVAGFEEKVRQKGIDFVITRRNGVLTPVGIEVNSLDCITNCKIYENVYTIEKDMSFGPWIQSMMARSQKYVLSGKKVLVIGAGGYSKAFIWPAAQDMEVKVVLVEANPNHFAAEEVSEFIQYDFSNHSQDDIHAVKIYQLLRKKNKKVDGCLTFWEDCVPLAAKLCTLLNLTDNSQNQKIGTCNCNPPRRGQILEVRLIFKTSKNILKV